MVFKLYDGNGDLAYVGENWAYARQYLDYLVRNCENPPRLEIVRGGVPRGNV